MKGVIDSAYKREELPTVLRGEVQGKIYRSGRVWGNRGTRAVWMPGSRLPLLVAGGGWCQLRLTKRTYLDVLRFPRGLQHLYLDVLKLPRILQHSYPLTHHPTSAVQQDHKQFGLLVAKLCTRSPGLYNMNYHWLNAYHTTVDHESCEISTIILKDLKIYQIKLILTE